VGNVTARRRATHLNAGQAITRPETLAVEEPLEIRVNGTPVTVTMRTPVRISNSRKAFCSPKA
jgi:FdhD protein